MIVDVGTGDTIVTAERLVEVGAGVCTMVEVGLGLAVGSRVETAVDIGPSAGVETICGDVSELQARIRIVSRSDTMDIHFGK